MFGHCGGGCGSWNGELTHKVPSIPKPSIGIFGSCGMEEEICVESFPYLTELENKIGRKTPQSLLVWARDAADCEDGWRSDEVDWRDRSFVFNDSFSHKISILKREMSWLRSADVRILRQLVAVHEGIEAMRWLMEERDSLVSHSSSLTGSLSSLVTVEGHRFSISPDRESPSQDLSDTAGEESEDRPPQADHNDTNRRSYFDMLDSESPEARPPHPLTSNFEIAHSTQCRPDQATPSPAISSVSVSLPNFQDLDVTPMPYIKTNAKTIRRALLRSSRARKDVKVDSIFAKQSEETQREDQNPESLRSSKTMETEASAPNRESTLRGYDAQWCWVESQDDVTFL